jgi:hypothetical protein
MPQVVPTTTLEGAGHMPAQALLQVYRKFMKYSTASSKIKGLSDYVNNPRNVQNIQNVLWKMHRASRSIDDFLLLSQFRNVVRFNGFFFACNVTGYVII